METIKNNKKLNSFMRLKKIFMLFMVLGCLSSIFAVNSLELDLDFEEGTGSVILDNSHNYFIFMEVGTSTFSSSYYGKGTYGMRFTGSNDYAYKTNKILNLPTSYTISTYYMKDQGNLANSNLWHTIAQFSNNLNQKFAWAINPTTKTFKVVETNEYYASVTYEFSTLDYDDTKMEHFTLTNDETNLNLYLNGVLIESLPLINPREFELDNLLEVRFADYNSAFFPIVDFVDLDGYLDEIKIYNFDINSSQALELFTNNYLDLVVPPEELDGNVITYISPEAYDNIDNNVNFEVRTLTSASCELYVNGAQVKKVNDTISFIHNMRLPIGENNYIVHCQYLNTDTNELITEITPLMVFNVKPLESGIIEFNIIGNDFEPEDLDLYITNPCFTKLITYDNAKTYEKSYNIERVVGGTAQFNLTEGTHEFCLFNGVINSDGKRNTSNFKIISEKGNVKIGEIFNPSNDLTSYNIKLDQFDIYGVTNPKAYGSSWTALICALVGLFIGLSLVLVGVASKAEKLAVIGAILILVSLGFTLNGFLGVMF